MRSRPVIKRALITGGASGFGESYARQLARRGVSLWLVDRQAGRLSALADELKLNGIEVETLIADLADAGGQQAVVELIERIGNLDLLINAAGFGAPGAFPEISIQTHIDMINVHVTCLVRFCHAALPSMLARGNGAIINVCSLAMYLHLAGNSMYGATKRFVETFTRSLEDEVAGRGVALQLLVPGYTRTPFHSTKHHDAEAVRRVPAALWMPVEKVTAASLLQLGSGRLICLVGMAHRLLYFVLRRNLFSHALIRGRVA